jgi:hypothetical protein
MLRMGIPVGFGEFVAPSVLTPARFDVARFEDETQLTTIKLELKMRMAHRSGPF